MAKRFATSGLFPVPNLPAAMAAVVHLYVSSFQTEDAAVSWNAQRLTPAQGRERIAHGELVVPGQGMAQAVLPPQRAAGHVIELNVTLPSDHIVPAVAIVTVFMGDESRDTVLWLPPSQFATA